jgi:glutathione S-transferase
MITLYHSPESRSSAFIWLLEELGVDYRVIHLMGDTFTAADVLMSGPFEWDPQMRQGNGRVDAWLDRLSMRPAARRAATKDHRPL